jgi:hypothetical protein
MSKKRIPWTSIEAYRSIMPSLTHRRRQVLKLLLKWFELHKEAPTGQELEAAGFVTGSWKRLPELAESNVIHRGPARKCAVTNTRACTWELGPADDEAFGAPPIDEGLLQRLRVLRHFAPDVPMNAAQKILACTEYKIHPLWDLKQPKGAETQLDVFRFPED